MASAADLVLRNFKWRLENLTLTHVRARKKLHWIDNERIDPESTAGLERGFNVIWRGEAPPEDEDVTDITERVQTHTFVVNVYYPLEVGLLDRQIMALKDRHDIYELLRNMDNRTGYSAATSSTDIGLWTRDLEEDWELDDESDFYWRYFSTWKCIIAESEV